MTPRLFIRLCLVTGFCLIASEIVLQFTRGPWRPHALRVQLDPPGQYFQDDPVLGYLPRAGRTTFTLPGPFSFAITNHSGGLRITHPIDTLAPSKRPEIWIFGCSFTAGWSLNDDESYAWLTQAQFPDYEVVNFGVDGYNTVQSLLQFRQALERRGPPALAMLAYASFHDVRNTNTPSWLKARVTFTAREAVEDRRRPPHAVWSSAHVPEIRYADIRYEPLPLARQSALVNVLDDVWNRLADLRSDSHEMSKALVRQLAQVSADHRVRLGVAGIFADAGTRDMLAFARQLGLMTVDLSVDLQDPKNTNKPFDAHPSAAANREYARTLTAFLCASGFRGTACG